MPAFFRLNTLKAYVDHKYQFPGAHAIQLLCHYAAIQQCLDSELVFKTQLHTVFLPQLLPIDFAAIAYEYIVYQCHAYVMNPKKIMRKKPNQLSSLGRQQT